MTNDPGKEAFLDQLSAEYAEAERLAPWGQNRSLADKCRVAIEHSLTEADLDSTTGSVPVIRCPSFEHAEAHSRSGVSPVMSTTPVEYCNLCASPMAAALMTGFWVNCGTVIAQLDLCVTCAKYAIDELGATAQSGVPDALPETW